MAAPSETAAPVLDDDRLGGTVERVFTPDPAVTSHLADVPGEGDHPRRAVNRDHRYRWLLGLADMVACAAALTVCIPFLGQGADRVPVGVFAGLPLVVLISKILGLYDRD